MALQCIKRSDRYSAYLERSIVVFLVVLASIIAVDLIFILSTHDHEFISTPKKDFFLEKWASYLNPEPTERGAFLCAIALIMPMTLIAHRIIVRPLLPKYLMVPASILLVFILCGPLIQSPFWALSLCSDVLGDANFKIDLIPVAAYYLCSVLIIYILKSTFFPKLFFQVEKRKNTFLPMALTFLVCITTLLPRIRTAEMMSGDMHFEAVYYSVAQVVGGATLLVDLPAQYGLYAELILPVIRLGSHSVLWFTTVFSSLQVLASIALLIAVFHLIRSPLMRVFVVMTLFTFIGSNWMFPNISPIQHEYYQIWPVRFLFPAIGLATFIAVRQRNDSYRNALFLGAVSGFSIIWNIDTGVPIFGAYIAYFIIRLFYDRTIPKFRIISFIVLIITAAVFVISSFMVYLSIKSNGQVPINEWFKYQHIFYATGFGMLPLPLEIHPWMTVIALYLLVFIIGTTAQALGNPTVRSDSLIFLSVLGFGLFTYYQGRSHIVVLSFVLWPAVLIAFILAEHVIRSTRCGLVSTLLLWAIVPTLAIGVSALVGWIGILPEIMKVATFTEHMIVVKEKGNIPSLVKFISLSVENGNKAVILDSAQAVLFAESGLRSALPGPGLNEMLLRSDQDIFLRQLKHGRIKHVFIRGESNGDIPEVYKDSMTSYSLRSRQESFLHFTPAADFQGN